MATTLDKDEAHSLVDKMPADATWDDLMHEIYVREVISDKPLHREILAQADLLMVISRDLQQYIGRLADPSKIRLTYNYINPRPILERVELHQRGGARRTDRQLRAAGRITHDRRRNR